MSYDLVHHVWSTKGGVCDVYTGCGVRSLSLRATANTTAVTCTACIESEGFQEAAAESMEKALRRNRLAEEIRAAYQRRDRLMNEILGTPFKLPVGLQIPDLRMSKEDEIS